MSWTIEDRMLHMGIYRLGQLGARKDAGGMREALRVHDIDPKALEYIGESLLTVHDVIWDGMPHGALRTRAELALTAHLGPLPQVLAHTFAASMSRAKLLTLSYQPEKRPGRFLAPSRVKLGPKVADAVCAAFESFRMPLGATQLHLAGVEVEKPLPVRTDVDPKQVLETALQEIATGRHRGSAAKAAAKALRLAHEIETARKTKA